MESIYTKLNNLTDEYLAPLKAIRENDWVYKPSPAKWSKNQIIGHLIDSAQNNIRRFIVAQYEDKPSIVYNQDKWVEINDYQHQPSDQLIQLWYLLNKQITGILKNTPDDIAQRCCNGITTHTIQWLASDYIKHLQHHLHQVLDLEPVAYP